MPDLSFSNPFADFDAPQAPPISKMVARVEFERRLRRHRLVLLTVMPFLGAAGAVLAVILRFSIADVFPPVFLALAGAGIGFVAGMLAALLFWSMMGWQLQGAGRHSGYNVLRDNTPIVLTIWLILWSVVGVVPGAAIGAIKGTARVRQKEEAEKRGARKYQVGNLAHVAHALGFSFELTRELEFLAELMRLPPDVNGTFVIFWIDENGETKVEVWPDDTARLGLLSAYCGACAGSAVSILSFLLWRFLRKPVLPGPVLPAELPS
jgi:hypothetical protein